MKKRSKTTSSFDIFTEESVLLNAPEEAGIYFLWAKRPRGKWDCIHVAQSDNIKYNLMQHLSESEANPAIRSKVQRCICGYEWSLAE